MHEGHRQRMYDKLVSDNTIFDHELLEILLFNGIPRKNTNPIAHELIDSFGSLAGVFDADIGQLQTIKGVGREVALYLKCVDLCTKRIQMINAGIAVLKNFEDFKSFTAVRMRGRTEEVLEFYCLEKNGKLKRIFSYTDTESNKVEVRTSKIANVIATACPYGLLVAHNHLSGNSTPSANDNRFTAELQAICSINNVVLYDHCIYASDNNVYSYFASGKIDYIRREFSFKKIIDNQFKLNANEIENKK
ncbi:MAG: hypothetical protein K2O89_00290 [Clostridia bacterium]|nr:hypothetical protein [Clostridia bacterium]